MKIQLIRNATMKLTYAGQTILTDPMPSAKDALDPFAGGARNPTVELPHTLEQILDSVDGVLVSHVHPDHFDSVASAALPKTIPVLCQPDDEQRITEEGFRTVISIVTNNVWNGITISRTGGQHGSGKILQGIKTAIPFIDPRRWRGYLILNQGRSNSIYCGHTKQRLDIKKIAQPSWASFDSGSARQMRYRTSTPSGT